VIENITLCDLLVENFCGDCVSLSRGCRNITVRNVSMRNFIRQGIQLAGDENARDYLVTGCQDLEHSIEPGGSTIHVEHARGLKNVIITANRCRHSLLASGVANLVLSDNVIEGRMEGNNNSNAIVRGNIVNGTDGGKAALMQFGYADGIIVKDNILVSASEDQAGLYVWGSSRYKPISLNGVRAGLVRDNLVGELSVPSAVKLQRCEGVNVSPAAGQP